MQEIKPIDMKYRNIVFDLGGVVFSRDRAKCSRELLSFFSFIAEKDTPRFWDEYDRGTLTYDEVVDELVVYRGCDRELCSRMVDEAIATQEEVVSTKSLISDLKTAGYGLYVLSNMSREFIANLREKPVYGMFDGEIVSCEIGTIKPEREIYRTLLSKYSLEASETLFIDDRSVNIEGAEQLGISTFLFDYLDPETSCRELRKILLNE